ncbi:MAG: enoyl-CoA hydratase/isomerase family protein, partial [Alphaproteobacteria bacterium]|nr:enoyl-CoA hydratase/isomerase family protein [Alphaproteobacteria bacterium]
MSDILASLDKGILRVTLNRGDDGNAATDDMAAEITRVLNQPPADARLVLLSGAGKDFCRGRASQGRWPAKTDEALDRRRQADVVFDCYASIRYCRLPVIAKVRGKAVGFGCSIASVSDITIAAGSALFQINEMEHNILPTMVLSSLIDRASHKGLKYMVYSAAQVPAERAIAYGLVSDVAPDAELDARVETLCAKLLTMPDIALEGVKDYLKRAMTMDVPSAVDFARNFHA